MGKRKNRTFKLKKKILMKGGGGFVQSLKDKIIEKRGELKTEEDKNNRPRFVKMLDDAIAEAREIETKEKKDTMTYDRELPAPPVKSQTDSDEVTTPPVAVDDLTTKSDDDSIYIFDKKPKKIINSPKFIKLFPVLTPEQINKSKKELENYKQSEIDDEIDELLKGDGGDEIDKDKLKINTFGIIDPDQKNREDDIANNLLKVMVNIETLQGYKKADNDYDYDFVVGVDDTKKQIERATAYLYFVREFYKNEPTKEDWKLDQLLVNLGYDPENDDKIDELFDTIFGENIFNDQLGKELQNPHSIPEKNPFIRLVSPGEKIGDEMQIRIKSLQKLWWLCRSIDILLETGDTFNILHVPYGNTMNSDAKSAKSWDDFSSGYAESIASKTECGESKMKSVFKLDKSSCDLYKNFHGSLNKSVKKLYEEKPNRTNEEGVKVDDIIAILNENTFKQEFKDIKRYDLLLYFLEEDKKNDKYIGKYYPKRRFNKIQHSSFMSEQKYMELLAQGKLETGGKRKRQRKTKRRKTQRRKKNITKRRKKRSYRRK